MKKNLFYYLPLLLLLLNSCSSEENNDYPNLILPKKIIYKDQNNKIYETTTFTYDGNKIVSVVNSDLYIDFTYDGNRIVKSIQYRNYGESYTEKLYSYSNDKLHKVNLSYSDREREYIYTYNNDIITKQIHNVDNKIGSDENTEDVFIVLNGNIVKSKCNFGNGYDVISNSYYEYDTKNNAFKNVTGLNLLIDQFNFGDEISSPSVNNITRYKVYYIQGSKSTIVFEPSGNVMKYEYNLEGYPIKKTTYDYADQIIEIIEYTY
ncbi:YD repeat-containing protein [Flavobacterium araucananum]|uniref:DUF4595 domain-containing protein n=1 Tax=Flavobacterium araucananum TaxID=946678 RepID=A0A227NX31_9FLAO|nr:hypothetical protein [Flavobacterium araucananum]OXG02257.1 hypothetical protein B0A64_18475 [Flavobacterium araucananum]PWJ96414.1 YD repeat-containing protein [Flavobacterium araucananum]